MTRKQVHRIATADPASSRLVSSLLAELQQASIRSRTPLGTAVSFVVSSWRQDDDGAFLVQLSPLAAERLPALSGIELLQAAQGMANAAALLPAEAAF
jgi:hypothetical protein